MIHKCLCLDFQARHWTVKQGGTIGSHCDGSHDHDLPCVVLSHCVHCGMVFLLSGFNESLVVRDH